MAETLAETTHKLELSRKRDARMRNQMHEIQGVIVQKAVSVLSAGVLGAMKHYNVRNELAGFPWKLGVWGATSLVQVFTGGMIQKAAGAVADQTLGIYTYEAIATGKVVAGGEDLD